VKTLTVVGSPPPVRGDRGTVGDRVREVKEQGIEAWARRSMGSRLGSKFPKEGAEWWIHYMARTPLSTEIGFVGTINFSENPADLPRIACPTLVIVTEGSSHASVAETETWVKQIPNASLKVLSGDSFHSAATDPDECARITLDFIERNGGT
jgi:pimeloyl-ACP methyl ester carboxylesterase